MMEQQEDGSPALIDGMVPAPAIPSQNRRKRDEEEEEEVEQQETTLDDLINDITYRLHTLATTESREELVHHFMTVLTCTQNEAEFFLESACWDIERAVIVCMDTIGQDRVEKHRLEAEQQAIALAYRTTKQQRTGDDSTQQQQQQRSLQVQIEGGLPLGWEARVSRTNGNVYFRNRITGAQQWNVPIGDHRTGAGAGAGAGMGGMSGAQPDPAQMPPHPQADDRVERLVNILAAPGGIDQLAATSPDINALLQSSPELRPCYLTRLYSDNVFAL